MKFALLLKCLVAHKIELSLFSADSSLIIFSTDLEFILAGDVGDDKDFDARQGTARNKVCVRYCSYVFAHSLQGYCGVQHFWRHKSTPITLHTFHFQAEIRKRIH